MRIRATNVKSYSIADLPDEYLRCEFPGYYDSIKKLKMKDVYAYLVRLS